MAFLSYAPPYTFNFFYYAPVLLIDLMLIFPDAPAII